MGIWASHLALCITFFLTGLWHGAGYTYIMYGVVHGVYIVIEQSTKKFRQACVHAIGLDRFPGVHALVQMLTVTGFVWLSWVFFRATSMAQAGEVFSGLVQGWGGIFDFSYWRFDLLSVRSLGLSKFELLLGVIPAALVAYVDWHLFARHSLPHLYMRYPLVRMCAVITLILLVMNMGVSRELPFIYFQF
jgi:hypothetical protein